ncbi:MAG: hypothetical protein A3F84_25380 [Candidatus Handelsmanbacteria bacterium RIFCSPLOWO2_12_FULL_64_10]|uniref:Cation/H+ exchanger domain-containing protein n=1 Tax=Handelsmanbacteria sp. (strain RIFCSPLOWO2_12_FULL_64_10) TaxID=1817868 RepID=A0A1F6C9I8_HANXR|nr:MAG: hypothetical protein A3F84_25380 [Candidatus Handelsmanbacteria bacterium RIFCSPLOWO2_12_FULL_64_10]
MRNLILFTCVVALAVLIQRGPSPVVEPTCYVGLLSVLAYFAGKLCQRLGLPVETGYVGVGVAARGFGVLPGRLFTMFDPLVAMALGWIGFGIGCEVGGMRDRWRPSHLSLALFGTLLPCLCAGLILKTLAGLPLAVALALGVAASLSGPVLTFVAPDHLPETTLVTVLCSGVSLLLYAPLTTMSGATLPFLLGVGGACGVALLWAETLVRVEPSLKADTPLIVLLLSMVILLPWTSALLGHSLFLTSLLAGLLTSWRAGLQPRLRRISAPVGRGAGALLLAAFGVQIAIERLPDLPKEVWGIAAIYLGGMIGGKLLGGALVRGQAHPYGRLAGIALLPQGLLLLEIDTQVRQRADLFGGAADTIHAVLTVAALVGSLALPLLDHLLRRVTMTASENYLDRP